MTTMYVTYVGNAATVFDHDYYPESFTTSGRGASV